MSASGQALLDGTADLAGALGDIEATQRTVRLQADLTAVVTGTPSADLTALLDDAADAETRGTAYTWRFSPASVRRALDATYPLARRQHVRGFELNVGLWRRLDAAVTGRRLQKLD